MDSWAEEQALMEAVIEAARELAEYHFADVADMGWTGCSPRQEWSDARRRCEDTVTALDDFRRAKKETTDGG